MAKDDDDGVLALLKEAVRLYETYGMIANGGACGKWVTAARDAIEKAEATP